MFSHNFKLLIGIRVGIVVLVLLPKCDPWPFVCFAMDSALYASMDVLDVVKCNMSCVCENTSMSVNPHNCDDMFTWIYGCCWQTLEERS